jgi:DNA invertase Pin-like site-specific DNA recombinase
MRAYSYIRFSSVRQADGDSLRRQVAMARQYAEEHGLELDEQFTYKDLGVSAFDRSNLEYGALGLFLQAARDGKVPRGSILLVEAFDRLTRSPPLVAVNLLSEIVRAGITIVTIRDKKTYTEESLNTSLADLMMSVVLLMAAHEEVKHRAARVRDYYQARRDARLPVIGSSAPGWLRKLPDSAGWELIPERGESIKKVFKLAATGLGGKAIARKANDEGWPVPSRTQQAWVFYSVLSLLKNRAVLGEYQPTTSHNGMQVPIGEPWQNHYPKVIDEETFLRVQAVRSRVKFGAGKVGLTYTNVFARLILCGTCGATLTLNKSRTNSDIKHMYFTCVDRQRNLSNCQTYRAGDVFKKLLPALLLHVRDVVLIASHVNELRDKLDTESARLADARQAQGRLLAMLEGGGDAASSGSASLDKLLLVRLQKVSQEVDQLETTCLDLKTRLEDSISIWDDDANDEVIAGAISAVFNPEKVTERASLHDKLCRVIERIWLYPGIAAAKRIGEDFIRWMPLEPEAASLVSNPPPIPPVRKHHKSLKSG